MPYVASDPDRYIGKPPVGTGECVPLVEDATGAPRAAQWSRGALVKGNTALARGTAIATFDAAGNYGNNRHGNHAAIYLGQDASGIQVVDQWNRRDKTGKIVGHQWPHERTIRFNDKLGASDNGNGFSVVQ